MIQHAKVDPNKLVIERLDTMLTLLLESSGVSTAECRTSFYKTDARNRQDTKLAEAAYTAATTIAFVAPSVAVDRLVGQVKSDLRQGLHGLGPEDYAIWRTPEGTLHVDGERVT